MNRIDNDLRLNVMIAIRAMKLRGVVGANAETIKAMTSTKGFVMPVEEFDRQFRVVIHDLRSKLRGFTILD